MSTGIAQIQKTQFKNNTGGWLGVVVIDPKGNDRGVSVEPDGTVWLSAAEQQLTANAPRRPEDNPFIEQTFTRRSDETGELEEVQITPLTVLSDMRYVPADVRPIPVTTPDPVALQHAQAAANGDEPVTVTAISAPALEREHALEDAPPTIKPNEPVVPPRAAAAAVAAQAVEDTPEADPFAETAADVPESAPGESTGTATPPTGEPTPGTYAADEEVGTPVDTSSAGTEAPTTDTPGEGEQPAPWQG